MAKKKVLYVSTKSVFGGAQRYIVDLVDYLPKEKFDVMVAAGGKGILAYKMSERRIPYFEMRGLDRDISIFHDIALLFRMISLFEREKPDIVHLNGSKVGVLGAIAARAAGVKKIIASTHGWPFLEERSKWQLALIRFSARVGAWFQDTIICVSRFDYTMGLHYHIANPKKMVLIQNGIDAKKHMFLPRAEARATLCERVGIPNKEYTIVGTIAEYTKNKGLFYVIEAARHVLDIDSNIIFMFLGWGEEKDFLEKQIKLRGLERNIYLVDSLPASLAFTYLKAFDIYIQPSIKEGFAYTLLEASLTELPIIATRVGGNPEIIENFKNGLLIRPTSPEEIINAISYLVREKKGRMILGEAARTKVQNELSISKMIEKTTTVYCG